MFRARSSVAAILLMLSVMALSTSALAAPETRTYPLNNRAVQEVADQVRNLFGDDQVRVTAQGQSMVIRGEPGILDEVGQLIQTLDVAPAQMRVSVRSVSNRNGKSGGAGISASNGEARIEGGRRVTSTRSNQQRSLVVQDGQSAHITQGQVRTVPVAIRGGRNPAAILEQVETRSGFLVSPQVISDRMVELSIMSFENDPEDDAPGFKTEGVMTIRRVETGEWVELGSIREQKQVSEKGITYQVGGDEQNNQSLEVRVDVM